MNRLLIDIPSARNVVPPLSPRQAGWLLPVLQANLKINATSSARLFLILSSFLPPPYDRHYYFLSQSHVSSLPSAFPCGNYFICLSPWALPGSGEGAGTWWTFLFCAVSSVPSITPNTQKSRYEDSLNEWIEKGDSCNYNSYDIKQYTLSVYTEGKKQTRVTNKNVKEKKCKAWSKEWKKFPVTIGKDTIGETTPCRVLRAKQGSLYLSHEHWGLI